ncbi:tudor domain-containing 6 [Nelusetta ayraudi]|uniref:tudor domain-containing 6 n=1 Tax=Nelusetta ayraudi TaxID=303726 RepID=UPI003F6FDA4C
MCSIPGLPTPGSDVSVLLMRVNPNASTGLVELWVNIDDGKKPIYQQLKKDIQIPERKFDGPEGKSGDLCLVLISNEWHRARIVLTEGENYKLYLIDQGQFHDTSVDALAWGKCDSFLLPPEIESCLLANVLTLKDTWPAKAKTLLKSLAGKKFNGLVQHVLMPDRIILLDIPDVSNDLCKCDSVKSLPVDEFKCFALKCLNLPKEANFESYCIKQGENPLVGCHAENHAQYFYPELSTNTFETVKVTVATNPSNIFCKLLIFGKALRTLSEQIHHHYEESSDFSEEQPKSSGDPCAAKGSDGRWYRSLLKQNLGDGSVKVFHVDEGNTELVPVTNIKPLHGKFLRMPVVTYPCCLNGVKDEDKGWTQDQIDFLDSSLQHQAVIARFDHHSVSQGVYYVTLYANSESSINKFFTDGAGLMPTSKTKHASDFYHRPTSHVVSLVSHEQSMNVQDKLASNGDIPEETIPSTKSQSVSGRVEDVMEQVDPFMQNNGHLLPASLPEEHSACDNHVYSVGSSVKVNISCIESTQKFWCQKTENAEYLELFMEALQKHYAFSHPQPLVESICVARNPSDGMWYRGKIITSHYSPLVDVRFIDYGEMQKVPLKDVRPIDPEFLQLNAQAFQCSLFDPRNPTNSSVTWSESALVEFQKFVESSVLSNIGVKCVIKAVTSDTDGMLLNVVDIKKPSKSASWLLAQRCTQAEDHEEKPRGGSTDAYIYSDFDFVVGSKEKVMVTASTSSSHFYCNLEKNSHLLTKLNENIQQFVRQPRCSNHKLGVNSLCLAMYNDHQWCRGQVIEMSKKPKVQFVDYGDTLTVSDNDICPLPAGATLARSVPVQAVLLGLFNVTEVEKEVNHWFADHAVGRSFTALVVAEGDNGKLFVELFKDSLDVNALVQRKISQIKQKTSGSDKKMPSGGTFKKVLNECALPHKPTNVTITLNPTLHEVDSSNGICAGEESLISTRRVTAHENYFEKTLDDGTLEKLDAILEIEQASHVLLDQADSIHPNQENERICHYKMPVISTGETEEFYASCIVGPNYFWCQHSNTVKLVEVSKLAQKKGQEPLDPNFVKTLCPGSPCIALFTDNQWYRAQVTEIHEDTFEVIFIDFGNEAEVDRDNVRPLPQVCQGTTPQAFMCFLNGFDKGSGSWDDSVYDVFYNLLVTKPIRVKVMAVQEDTETALPQFAVQVECEDIVVNNEMLKYWIPKDQTRILENSQSQTLLHSGQVESDETNSLGIDNTCRYKYPTVSNKKEEVYASCIAEPGYFWCQYANTEELNDITRLAQEAGQAPLDKTFTKTLAPGSPCLALFSSDNQWYRAQIIKSQENGFNVVFIDYGNESDVDSKCVRALPRSLLERAPQAFLCAVNGFDKSQGSWDDAVYDVFHSLLVDKPLRLTVIKIEEQAETEPPQYSVDVECGGESLGVAIQKYWRPVPKEQVTLVETLCKEGQTQSSMTNQSVSEENTYPCMYTLPNISLRKKEQVYASCIAEPGYFWCQYATTEKLNEVIKLAQDAGQTPLDITFSNTLGPGSPCLALFPSDNQWYRAQVTQKLDNGFQVLFIDYGNESDIDQQNVRPVPKSVLEKAPQAFLCSLSGFDQSQGSWDDDIYDVFYNLLVDKPLTLTVFDTVESQNVVPQHKVQIECQDLVTCEWLCVNTLVEKHWKRRMSSAAGMDSVYQDGEECFD